MLTPMELRLIKSMEGEYTQEEIAEIMDVSQSTVSRVLKGEYRRKKADRMEAFGLVTRDDGCYTASVLTDEMTLAHEYKTPAHEVDWNTPDAVLEAEQEIEERLKNGQKPE